MVTTIHCYLPRFLLLVLFATFLSPGFAWQKVASHGPSTHADPVVMAAHADHDHHHADAEAAHDHDDAAHGQIGHLLSHLPVMTAGFAPILPRMAGGVAYPAPRHAIPHADPEPPYKPPRNPLSA